MKRENEFQAEVIKEVKKRIPGCIVLKNDADYIQGFPDLTILADHWYALLECKRCVKASRRPNQDYYVNRLNEMSFARFIYPENKEVVLDELQRSFENGRTPRHPEPE